MTEEKFCMGCEDSIEPKDEFGPICPDCFKKIKRSEKTKPVEVALTGKQVFNLIIGQGIASMIGSFLGNAISGNPPDALSLGSIDDGVPRFDPAADGACLPCTLARCLVCPECHRKKGEDDADLSH